MRIPHRKSYTIRRVSLLAIVDPAGKAAYEANAAAYLAKLDTLDQEVKAAVAAIPAERRKIITTHDAFGYFEQAYGVAFIAPQGVSTEAEPSARDIARIITQVKKQKIPAVFLENITDPRPVLFYFFSGPDFLYANAFFPAANTYVLAGLEPVGHIAALESHHARRGEQLVLVVIEGLAELAEVADGLFDVGKAHLVDVADHRDAEPPGLHPQPRGLEGCRRRADLQAQLIAAPVEPGPCPQELGGGFVDPTQPNNFGGAGLPFAQDYLDLAPAPARTR